MVWKRKPEPEDMTIEDHRKSWLSTEEDRQEDKKAEWSMDYCVNGVVNDIQFTIKKKIEKIDNAVEMAKKGLYPYDCTTDEQLHRWCIEKKLLQELSPIEKPVKKPTERKKEKKPYRSAQQQEDLDRENRKSIERSNSEAYYSSGQ